MISKTLRAMEELAAIAQTLTPLEQELLQSLQAKGPGVLLELAVSVYKFPEDIDQEVTRLRNLGLIEADALSGVKFGNEVLYLSEGGRQVLDFLREETLHPHNQLRSHGLQPTESIADPRQQEVEILRKLGDLAVQEGNATKAREHYEEALKITRLLGSASA